jgi:hypothetical protein
LRGILGNTYGKKSIKYFVQSEILSSGKWGHVIQQKSIFSVKDLNIGEGWLHFFEMPANFHQAVKRLENKV